MDLLTSLTYAQLREMTSPKLSAGSPRRAILPILLIAAVVTAYFGWLYFKDWQMKRNFRRYWQGKGRKPEK
jgi:hypothetical protein